jgi:AcrR family transcriptional regulator
MVTRPAGRLRIARAQAPPSEADGRRRRSQDSRARIVAAMLELVHAGEVSPAAEDVAARAQVGLRTVFRHFRDMESLYREMAAVIEDELHAVIDQPLHGAGWRERLDEILERRVSVYEKIAPFKRAADVHRRESAFLEASHARLVATSREILRRELLPAVARDRLRMEAVDLLLSFEAWSRLRREQGLSARRGAEVVRALLDGLLREG